MSSDFFIQKNLYNLIKNILKSAFIINHYIEAYKDILHFLYVIFRCENHRADQIIASTQIFA